MEKEKKRTSDFKIMDTSTMLLNMKSFLKTSESLRKVDKPTLYKVYERGTE